MLLHSLSFNYKGFLFFTEKIYFDKVLMKLKLFSYLVARFADFQKSFSKIV
jgi:hypothetical protein